MAEQDRGEQDSGFVGLGLPVLTRLGQDQSKPAALVLAPTRELAIQVAEAFHRYAAHLP